MNPLILRRVGALLLTLATAPSFATQALAAGVPSQDLELIVRYDSPPKVLPTPGASSGLLLVNIDMKLPGGTWTQLVGAALVATESSSVPIRVKALTRQVVLFPLPTGTYTLRFIVAENPNAKLLFEIPCGSEYTVSVIPGGISYLGTVTVQKRIGFRPPEIRLAHDVERERDSWATFLKKYPNAPWADLARARLDSVTAGISLIPTPVRSQNDTAAVEQRLDSLNSVGLSHARQGEYGAAVRAYEEALGMTPESSDPSRARAHRWVQNNLAWLLATAPDSAARNGPRALVLAEQLVALCPSDAAYLDTFAAAYAEVGRLADAVKTQRKALAALGGGSLRDEYRKHLKSYEDGKPWREP
jgi:hypothetical protein